MINNTYRTGPIGKNSMMRKSWGYVAGTYTLPNPAQKTQRKMLGRLTAQATQSPQKVQFLISERARTALPRSDRWQTRSAPGGVSSETQNPSSSPRAHPHRPSAERSTKPGRTRSRSAPRLGSLPSAPGRTRIWGGVPGRPFEGIREPQMNGAGNQNKTKL